LRERFVPSKQISSLYFGGGTPSLFSPPLLQKIFSCLFDCGFVFLPDVEVTIEINPATITAETLAQYLYTGFNRFSVGAQSFSEMQLKSCGREHSVDDTLKTIELLRSHAVNFSLDLLFALPQQNSRDLAYDLDMIVSSEPKHVSPYILTVPNGHPLSKNRPLENEQIEMFHLVDKKLCSAGFEQYEISNYSKPGFESRHNICYWSDQAYWGIGLSAHSYFPQRNLGLRFWNPKSMALYEKQLEGLEDELLPITGVACNQFEALKAHEALTDYCHMHLRMNRGLQKAAARRKFGAKKMTLLSSKMQKLLKEGLIEQSNSHWALSPQGRMVSNQVFLELTFSAQELSAN